MFIRFVIVLFVRGKLFYGDLKDFVADTRAAIHFSFLRLLIINHKWLDYKHDKRTYKRKCIKYAVKEELRVRVSIIVVWLIMFGLRGITFVNSVYFPFKPNQLFFFIHFSRIQRIFAEINTFASQLKFPKIYRNAVA